MTRKICTLLILFLTIITNGQNVTLLKNFNPKAAELIHNLNNSNDSLVIQSKKTIIKVDIFNEDYEKMIEINDNEAQISLDEIPIGKFVVEVKLEDKIIVMDIIKYEQMDNSNLTQNNEETAEGKGMMLDEKLNLIKSAPKNSIEFLLTREKSNKKRNKKQTFFWTLTKVNNESGSSKTMRLVMKESVEKMILRNKLENNSTSGKLNELIIWEVYDTTKFMENQVSNPDFVYSSTSDVFNTSPYYSTENNIQNP